MPVKLAKTKQTKSPVDVAQLPQKRIGLAIAHLCRQKYGVKWEPRVVRQHRVLRVGSLEFIDYAVPCFELARLVGGDATSIAHSLCEDMVDAKGRGKSPLPAGSKVEAVGGYINFELSEEYIARIARLAKEWLSTSTRPAAGVTSGMLVLALPMPQEGFEIADMAHQYLRDVNKVIGERCATSCLISDFSEKTEDYLLGVLRDPSSSGANMQLRRQVRAFLSGQNKVDKRINRAFRASRKAWLVESGHSLSGMPSKDYAPIFESDIVDSVNRFVDTFNETTHDYLIVDETSKAAYYQSGQIAIPLRSASGMLFSLAYVLYLLDELLTQLQKKTDLRLAVMVPQSMHSALYSFVRSCVPESEASRVVCFDPMVSRADILQIGHSVSSVGQYAKQVAARLGRLSSSWLTNPTTRQAVLHLIDLPLELKDYTSRQQLPLLFDTLSQSTEVLALLNDQA